MTSREIDAAAIASASEKQHQVNVERRVNDFGVDTRARSGMAFVAIEEVALLLQDSAEKQQTFTDLVVPMLDETVEFLGTIPGEKAAALKQKLDNFKDDIAQ